MADFFNKIAGGAEKMQAEFLGPTYNYAKNIASPNDMGMSGDGNMTALGKDITGIIAYTKLLVEGTGDANKIGKPLGNKFFLKTGGQCMSPDGNKHDRYIYINNVPTGSLPIISDATGQAFGDFRGLIPGTIGNVGEMDPPWRPRSRLTGNGGAVAPRLELVRNLAGAPGRPRSPLG